MECILATFCGRDNLYSAAGITGLPWKMDVNKAASILQISITLRKTTYADPVLFIRTDYTFRKSHCCYYCCCCSQGGGSLTPATDVICPMYARIPQLQALAAHAAATADPRPVMLCEYVHSMGNR